MPSLYVFEMDGLQSPLPGVAGYPNLQPILLRRQLLPLPTCQAGADQPHMGHLFTARRAYSIDRKILDINHIDIGTLLL